MTVERDLLTLGLERMKRLARSPAHLLARVAGHGGEDVGAKLTLLHPPSALAQGRQRGCPCRRVDVLDLLVGQGSAIGARDHRPGGPPHLLEQPAASLRPVLGSVSPAGAAGSLLVRFLGGHHLESSVSSASVTPAGGSAPPGRRPDVTAGGLQRLPPPDFLSSLVRHIHVHEAPSHEPQKSQTAGLFAHPGSPRPHKSPQFAQIRREIPTFVQPLSSARCWKSANAPTSRG